MKTLSIMAKACDKSRQSCSAIFYNASKNECIATDGHVALIQKEGFPFQSQTDIAIDPATLTPVDPAFAPTPPDYERIEFNPGDPDVTEVNITSGDLYVRTSKNKNIAREVIYTGGAYFDKKYLKLSANFLGHVPTGAYRKENVFRFSSFNRRAYLMPVKTIRPDDYKLVKKDGSMERLARVDSSDYVFLLAVQTPDAPVRVFKNKKRADDVAKALNTEVIPVLVED